MLIKAMRVLKITGKALDSSLKIELNILIKLVSILFFSLDMSILKGIYNNVSVNVSHMRERERERHTIICILFMQHMIDCYDNDHGFKL